MKEIDITGRRFGRLTAMERDGYSESFQSMWLCRCDCGKVVRVFRNNLMAGRVRSCGCLKRDLLAQSNRRHGSAVEPEQG